MQDYYYSAFLSVAQDNFINILENSSDKNNISYMNVLVTGAGGFIGGHLVKSLASQGYSVTAVDIKEQDNWYQVHKLNEIENLPTVDLKDREVVKRLLQDKQFHRVYNLACNMGGMGFIQNNHIACLENVYIQTNFIALIKELNYKTSIMYSSSACVYPQGLQKDPSCAGLKESEAYPADPEDGYGWEKLFSEIITQYGAEEQGLDVRIVRFHNVYGPYGTFDGGREKAPAALCRKVIEAQKNQTGEIEIWGDGQQTRSFMYIDDCMEGMHRVWESQYNKPLNIGSSEIVTINQMVDAIEQIAGTKLKRNYLMDKPQGVRGRNSDNTLIKKITSGWEPPTKLYHGLEKTYSWIYDQII